MVPSSPPASWVRCYSSWSPLTLLRNTLWCPLVEGSVNKSQSQELRASCCCKLRTQPSSSVLLDSIDPQRTWPLKNYAGVFVKNLLHGPIKCKKLPFPKNSREVLWLTEPKFCSSSWFHSSACLQYMLPSIWVQSVPYLCHPWLKDKNVSYHLNFWTGSCTKTHAPPLGMLLRGYTVAVIYCSRRKKRNICIQFSISRWHTAFFILQ